MVKHVLRCKVCNAPLLNLDAQNAETVKQLDGITALCKLHGKRYAAVSFSREAIEEAEANARTETDEWNRQEMTTQ